MAKAVLAGVRSLRPRVRRRWTLLLLAPLWIAMPALESRAEALDVDVGLFNGAPDSAFGGAADQLEA